METTPAPEETVARLVREMNAAWLDGRIDEMERFFDPGVVFAPPAGTERIVGRDAILDGFRDYVRQAVTHRFDEVDLHVDVIGTTAVASLRFDVRYEMGGTAYDERGRDLLVLSSSPDGSWRIVWRTQTTEETQER